MDEFNCNFNAPMFVDFEREDLDSNPESYFEVDHEARLEAANAMAADDDPVLAEGEAEAAEKNDEPSETAAAEPEPEKPKQFSQRQERVYRNIVTSWKTRAGSSRPASGASLPRPEINSMATGDDAVMTQANVNDEPPPETAIDEQQPQQKERVYKSVSRPGPVVATLARPETPTRKALRQAVAETVAAVTNSPKLNLPMRGAVPKRLHTGGQPRLGGATAKPAETTPKQKQQQQQQKNSPSVSRLRKVLNQMTPEVLKNAREAKRLKQMAAAEAKNSAVVNSNDNKTVVNASTKYKEQLATNRRMAVAKSVSVPLKGVPLPVIKPVHPTNPQPFKFATDSRIKPSGEPKTGDSTNQIDFLKMLRTYKPSSSTASSSASGPTQVKPFSFAQATTSSNLRSRSRSVDPSPSRSSAGGAGSSVASGGSGAAKFVSTAEMMQRFQNGTPDRFHSKPRSRSSSVGIRRRSPSPQLTRAQTPKLMTRGRNRSQHVLSREQLEEMALEEAKKNQFRATAINEGVKPFRPLHLEKRPSTRPEPFNLTEYHAKGSTAQPEESNVEFHAKPAPKKILEGPVGIPERRPAPLVEPQSPAFALTDRLANRRRQVSSGESGSADEERIHRARPAPHFGVPVILPSTSKKMTTAEPFSFYERDAAMMEKKQQKISAILDEEKKRRDFKAKPVPDLRKPVNLPMKEVLLPTKPEPFALQIEKRVGERHQKWQEDVEKQLEEQREAAKFHARPATVLEKQPFVPKQSDKPLSEVSNFELHSDRRAREREDYDQHRRQKESELDGMKRQLEERRIREEEIEIQRLRREAVHKAQPIRQYAPIEVHPSDKPLTEPMSPKFSKLSRERKVTENEAANTTFDM